MIRVIKLFRRVVSKTRLFLSTNYWRTRNICVLIYTGGKVGSSTVYYNLKNCMPNTSVLHVHFLSETWLKSFRESGKWLSNIGKAQIVSKTLSQNPNKKVKIITLVRDPIARDVSDIFQNWKTIFEINKIDELKEIDVQNYLSESKFNQTETWFDTEFKEYTGINILDMPFDKQKGYSIYNFKECDILCLKLEMLNKVFDEATDLFLGVKNIKNNIRNVSLEKEGADLYKKIKDEFNLSENRLNEIYSTQFLTHFYSEKEIVDFVNKWKTK